MPTITLGARVNDVKRSQLPAGNLFRRYLSDGKLGKTVYLNTGARTNPPSGAADVKLYVGGALKASVDQPYFGVDKEGKRIVGWGGFRVGEVNSSGRLVASSKTTDGSMLATDGNAMVRDLGSPTISVDRLS